MTGTPLYHEISHEEFLRERTRQFAADSPEVTGIRFVTISHEGSERLNTEWPSQDWQSNLGPISQVMPLDYESYAGIVLPFVAFRGQERREVDGPAEAYSSFGLPRPESLTLDRLYSDFQVIEGCKAIPPLARAVLNRFAETATTVLVKSAPYGENEAAYWTIERELFFALEDPSQRCHTLAYLQLVASTRSSRVAGRGTCIIRGIHRSYMSLAALIWLLRCHGR